MRLIDADALLACRQCFRVYQSYIGLRHRYDCLKAAIDILRDQNTGYLKMVRQIEDIYETAEKETDGFKDCFCNSDAMRNFDEIIKCIPPEAWIQ